MLYVMSDFHLSTNTNKPMDKFGDNWINHAEKIKTNWPLKESDVIIMPGDFSWALKLEELHSDLEWLDALPGKKILTRGNHDLWWTSSKKLNEIASKYKTISFLHNDAIEVDDISICVAKGYNIDLTDEEAMKFINRESIRLDISLSKSKSDRKMVFIHYPPLSKNCTNSVFSEIMKKHKVERCYYGHLHGKAHDSRVEGMIDGIEYKLISSDYLNFVPIRI